MTEKKEKFPYKKAMVTGGSGFIGSHIVDRLVHMKIPVISVDSYIAGKGENLSHLQGSKYLEDATCDITDRSALESAMEGVDVIFHNAAAKKTVCMKDPRMDLRTNAEGAYNILDLAVKHKVKKVVMASTGSVYGEAQYFPQDENHPFNPTSFYGVSKLAGERYGSVFHHLHNLDVTILRYFHVYGPRQEYSDVGGVVSIFARKIFHNQPIIIYGDGSQQRSFTYVDDVVDINLLAAVNPYMKGEAYNCASGIKVTVLELAEKLKKIFNAGHLAIKHEDWTPGDIKVFDVDNKKLRSLGFEFKTNFDEGLMQTSDWINKYFQQKERG